MKSLYLAALLCLLPQAAFAWGAIGHRSVALVAEAKLNDAARAGVHELLGNDSLADVANWADSLKSGDGYKQTVWYHFEKIPDGVSYLDNLKAMPDWQKKKGGLLSAILLACRILRDPLRHSEQTDALKFLVHFVGDLHQPLHSGRPEDNGGVKLDITWMGEKMSLHHLWDTGLISTGHPDFTRGQTDEAASRAYAAFLLGQPGAPVSSELDVEGWLIESLALRTAAYDKLYETDQPRYQTVHLPEVDLRIRAGGEHLAALLNDIFAKQAAPEREVSLVKGIESVIGPLEQTISFKP